MKARAIGTGILPHAMLMDWEARLAYTERETRCSHATHDSGSSDIPAIYKITGNIALKTEIRKGIGDINTDYGLGPVAACNQELLRENLANIEEIRVLSFRNRDGMKATGIQRVEIADKQWSDQFDKLYSEYPKLIAVRPPDNPSGIPTYKRPRSWRDRNKTQHK